MSRSFLRRRFAAAPIAAAGVVLAAVAALPLVPGSAQAQSVRTPQVEAELVAEHTSVVPGRPTTVALRLKIADGWHTYWRNPGDSGLPTKLAWKLPAGVTAGPIQWPYPSAFFIGPLVNYGYEGQAMHLVELDVPAGAVPGTRLDIAARADWLVCRETCIPEGADLRLALPVSAEPGDPGRWASSIATARDRLPRPLPAGWKASAQGIGQAVELRIAPASAGSVPGGNAKFDGARFFPFAEGRIEASGAQRIAGTADGAVFTLPVANQLVPGLGRLDGVVVVPAGWGDAGRAFVVDVPLAGSVVPGPSPTAAATKLDLSGVSGTGGSGFGLPGSVLASSAPGGSLSLWIALASALIGGVLLNLMPCVFPVLSLKLLSFAAHGHRARREVTAKALAFAAGVLVSFWVLAGVLLALKAGGQQLGWGFQLQSPPVIVVLSLLFFVIGLNLSGVFEFGSFAPGSVAAWQSRRPMLDAFGSGVLAVLIASPCTAPFMGAALGYALAQPAASTLAVFTVLALGMATPFVLLSQFPGWRRWLPKPGPWMRRLRQLLAFPMYATVIWLAWVLGVQLGVDAMLRLLATLLVVALAAWLLAGGIDRRSGAWRVSGWVALLVAGILSWPVFSGTLPGPTMIGDAAARTARADGPWEPWSVQRVESLTSAGGAVFVDFTAAWCVTCQVNKQLVLSRDSVVAAFRDRGVTLLRADWTRQDPEITRALQALGRNGVPVYALYRPGKNPVLLPEILSEASVREALATL